MKDFLQPIINKQVAILYCLTLVIVASLFTFAMRDYSPVMTMTNTTFALNTAYQPSSIKNAFIVCGGSITSTLSLSGGQSGTVLVQTSPDNITYTTIGTMTNNNTGTLTVGLNTSQAQSSAISFMLPRNYYFKLVSSGTSTITSLAGQQILF